MGNPRRDCGTKTGDGQKRRIRSGAETKQKARGHPVQSTDVSVLILEYKCFQVL